MQFPSVDVGELAFVSLSLVPPSAIGHNDKTVACENSDDEGTRRQGLSPPITVVVHSIASQEQTYR